jgi:twitching motility two-component system response regulator PilG
MDNFIMIVDDSPTIRKIIEITLQQAGYRGVSFADGVAALTWLDGHPDVLPVFIFIDVQMPGIDGYELTRRIKSQPRFRSTAIILMSGEAMNEHKGRLAGVAAHLKKPFTVHAILTTVQAYVLANAIDRSVQGELSACMK